ncbi:MAG: hypothetical protein BWZ07_01233 [Alphaproteobacteria bacterium ADurb.BinA280]|jgi:uncharacterized protein|nr:MAG: hypothetical protein BWZ07_01233 [Alphaproteobacteria bacterium ADurb.BinA280]
MHSAPDSLRAQQLALTRSLRDPQLPGPEGIDARRLKVYQDLLFNNLHSLLSSQFPVIASLRGKHWWDAQVRAFFREHRARTPLFPELGQEFIAWLLDLEQQGRLEPPFLRELAHYEWAELALAISDVCVDRAKIDPAGDLLAGAPVLSPLAWPLAYRYPVDQLRADFQPTEPATEPCCFLLQRDSQDKVRFSRIDLLSFLLLTRLQQFPGQSGRHHLQSLAEMSAVTDVESFQRKAADLLQQLREREVILGTLRQDRPA